MIFDARSMSAASCPGSSDSQYGKLKLAESGMSVICMPSSVVNSMPVVPSNSDADSS